ncbi:MAG: hypothetical protein ACLRMZ_00360 [Blautia marasmi]
MFAQVTNPRSCHREEIVTSTNACRERQPVGNGRKTVRC